jgi:hypothetical protein
MRFQPLQHNLGQHLSDPRFTASGQVVYVGTKPLADGWVAAVIRIDNVVSEAEASWLGARIRADVLTHLRFANQEFVPAEAVDAEYGAPHGSRAWSLAVYVTLASPDEAAAMKKFFKVYVDGVLD